MNSVPCRRHMPIHTGCLLLALWVAGLPAQAAPRLPGFFSDHMVLQRDAQVPVWGWADPGETVTVSFAQQTHATTAGPDGRWQVTLAPLPASEQGHALRVTSAAGEDPNAIVRTNIVVGDVWVCSGQSNMAWPLQAAHDAGEEIANAKFPLIRHLKIGHNAADLPLVDVAGQWQVCTPETAGSFTAVGYFFARKLHRELGVPIGLIGSNWGGTRIEPWTPPEGFRSVPELNDLAVRVDATLPTTATGQAAYQAALAELRDWLPMAEQRVAQGTNPPPPPRLPSTGNSHQSPTRLYNAMIHPLLPYAIRGAIWYQGESNGGEGLEYYHKMQALIGGWRAVWNQGDFPFYFVQLANFGQPNTNPAGGDGYSGVRDAQRRSLSIDNTGMAVIIDIGEARNIHPRNKQDVGRRLARWALANEYGQTNLVSSGPLYKGHVVDDGAIRVTFEHVGAGLMVGAKNGLEPAAEDPAGTLKRFAIAGADGEWHWAAAVIEGDTVVVSSPEVTEPVAVSYAFSHNPEGCNLYNREGLPASPFQTHGK